MTAAPPSQALLTRVATGSPSALEELLPIVYDELRGLANVILADRRRHHTLQPTALVHEAYARLVQNDADWNGRVHVLSVAALAMRQVLIDHARARRAKKRGGDSKRVALRDEGLGATEHGFDLVEVADALERLTEAHPRSARVVELRFFAGLTVDETASLLGVSSRTVSADWRSARAWLRANLTDVGSD